MHSLGIVQWNSTRRDHLGYPGRVSGMGPVICYCYMFIMIQYKCMCTSISYKICFPLSVKLSIGF